VKVTTPIEELLAQTIQAKQELEKLPALPEKGLKATVKKVGKEVEEFTLKSNAVDVAIGVLIGAAITPLVESLIKDMIMPPFALLFGGAELDTFHWVLKDGPTPGTYTTIEEAKKDGAVIIRYGAFVHTIMNAIIIMAITILIIKLLNAVRREGGFVEYIKQQTTAVTKALGQFISGVRSKRP
jgi:large conductance mechanosensitive channel